MRSSLISRPSRIGTRQIDFRRAPPLKRLPTVDLGRLPVTTSIGNYSKRTASQRPPPYRHDKVREGRRRALEPHLVRPSSLPRPRRPRCTARFHATLLCVRAVQTTLGGCKLPTATEKYYFVRVRGCESKVGAASSGSGAGFNTLLSRACTNPPRPPCIVSDGGLIIAARLEDRRTALP